MAAGIEVAAVVTKADRPSGRGLKGVDRPVAQRARELGLLLHQPEGGTRDQTQRWLQALTVQAAVVVAYGSILPKELIEIPPLGFVNLHFSLLPRYRGAAPVARALMDGSDHTGVSTMVLTEGMDEGPVLARKRVPIDPDDTAGSLGARLAGLGGELLVSSLLGYERGDLIPEPQDHSSATYAPKITEAEARVSWGASSRSVRDLIRGLNPSPGAWTTLRAERVKLHRAERAREEPALAPGELAAHKELWVGTGDGALVLSEVQLAGRKRMSGADLVRGLRLQPGERFD